MSTKKAPKRNKVVKGWPGEPPFLKQELTEQNTERETYRRTKGGDVCKVEIVKGHGWEKVIAITAIIAVLTGGYFQWRQIHEYKEAVEDELKAYVGLDIEVDSLRVGELLGFRLYIKNLGKTPAHELGVIARGWKVGDPIQKEESDEYILIDDPQRAMVLPTAIYRHSIFDKDTRLTKKDILDIRLGRKVISFWGVIEWRDNYETWNSMRFAIRYEGINRVLNYRFGNEIINERLSFRPPPKPKK